MAEVVLDASALLPLLQREPGTDRVRQALRGAVMGSADFAEVVTSWCSGARRPTGSPNACTISTSRSRAFDRELALAAGALHAETTGLGLSVGDRSCLALAAPWPRPVLTTDRAWRRIDLGIEVELIR